MIGNHPRRLCWILMMATVITISSFSVSLHAQSTITMPDFDALRVNFDSDNSKPRSTLNLFKILGRSLLAEQEASRRDRFGIFESLQKPHSAKDSFLLNYTKDPSTFMVNDRSEATEILNSGSISLSRLILLTF